VRPRSATDWRAWWADGGEQKLRAVFLDAWPPLQAVDEETRAHYATRLATLLGSRSPLRAIAAELGRMRAELALPNDADEDAKAAERVQAWFPAGGIGSR
jgi:hypothetical protein